MAVKALAKVVKRITNKKKTKALALHEKSRDSRRLNRAELREDKIHRTGAERERQNLPYYTRVTVFAAAARNRKTGDEVFNVEQLQELVNGFINRHAAELEQLTASRRPGRPLTVRHQALITRMSQERQEFNSGMWIPDMFDSTNVCLLAGWNGDWPGLGHIRFIRLTDSGLVKPSLFPPNGRS